MAFKKTNRTRTQRRQPETWPRGPAARLPHPSWRLAPAFPSAADIPITSASDFWSRLGL